MTGRKYGKTILYAVAVSLFLTILASNSLIRQADRRVSDLWYQSRQASDGEIVMIGIDQKALEEIGPYGTWGRDIIATVIETLNVSEECRPAAIGLDVLYTGEKDPYQDEWLAEAAGAYGNVVSGCAAGFDNTLEVRQDGTFYMDDFHIAAVEEPYPALKSATTEGHINAMLDTDGILRHQLLRLKLPDGREIPSLSLALVQKYCEYYGISEPELPPTDSRGFWYLPFCGKPGDFDESISVADILSGAADPEYFAGKIVLIGPYATGLQDSYITAADHAEPMYGMEIHANAVQAILWENYKKEAGALIQSLILFVLLAVSFAGFWKQNMRVSTAVWIGVSGGYLLITKYCYEHGLVLQILLVPACVTILYVGCIAWNYIRSVLEKRRVTSTFKRYVAPEIVNEILKEGTDALELGGKLTRIAVLFVDIRGFTPMSEMLQPPQVVEILNRYLTLIATCILKNGGTLDKFVGDAAMAFWGAPLPQEDYIMNAVKAAADMKAGSEALSRELLERYGRTVSFGIGVHVGEAVVGNIGSPDRMDYTAIGDTVNTAARLEANAPAGTIYISRAVADSLEGRIRVTSLGDSIKLKGKKEGFEVLVMDSLV